MANEKPNPERKERQDGPNPEYDNFQKVLEQVLSVPKGELDKMRAEHKRERKEKRAG